MKDRKVFGIGFHKTGTTSLASALRQLGYTVTGPDGAHNPKIAEEACDIVMELSKKFDAFQDNPWPIFYKELDEQYPGSKFILTIRPDGKWINSLKKHFGTKVTPMREWIYGTGRGCPIGNEQLYLERYERHNREVIEYFKTRPDDLLVFSLTEGDGWEKLCTFLNEKIQKNSFPHENSVVDREVQTKRQSSFFNRLIKFLRKF